MKQGQAAAVAALALIVAYRMSPRRVRTTEVLLLVGLGASALWTSRMIVWWAPVAVYCLVLHAAAALRCQRSRFSRRARLSTSNNQNHLFDCLPSVCCCWVVSARDVRSTSSDVHGGFPRCCTIAVSTVISY